MKPLSIDITDKKWIEPSDDESWRYPTDEAWKIVLKDYGNLLEPDPWFVGGGWDTSENHYTGSLPANLQDAFDILDCGEAIGLIAVGMTSPTCELQYSVYDCMMSELNEPGFERGHNYVSASWINTYRPETRLKFEKDFGRMEWVMARARVHFFIKLQAGEFQIYGIPNIGSAKYQPIPIEFLMYPMQINYLANNIYISAHVHCEDGGYSELNQDLARKIEMEIAEGVIPSEWQDIKIKNLTSLDCGHSP